MVNLNPLAQLKRRYRAAARARLATNEQATSAQHAAKLAVFAAQRGDLAEAAKLIGEAGRTLRAAAKQAPRLGSGAFGSFRAAQEEYAEAQLFVTYLAAGKLLAPAALKVPDEAYLGALSDFVGELARYAVKLATTGQVKTVGAVVADATEVVHFLAAVNLTGNLRSKFDQAKQHLRKLEDIAYDLHIHRHGG